jgi:uncharacterized protein (DUF885 family)
VGRRGLRLDVFRDLFDHRCMKLQRFAAAAAALWLVGVAPAPAAANAPPSGFDRLADEFLFEALALSPIDATASGYHVHKGVVLDDLLDDFSQESLDKQRRLLKDFEARFAAFDPKGLDREQKADRDIVRDAIAANLLDMDEIQSYRHNPNTYVELIGSALYTPYVLHYAPVAERYKHIIERLKRLPTLVGQAQANLADSPEIWNTTAREENAGNIDLIDGTLRKDCPQSLRKDFDVAAAPAIESLKSFNDWLEKTLSKKTSDWRLGHDLYAKKFRLTLATGKTPEELLAEAQADLKKTREEMVTLAAPKTVEQALNDIAKQHATPDTYMASAREALAAATAFVKQKDLLTLSPNSNLRVIETPEFMRESYSVGGFSGAPPLEPKLGAFFWVTPIPPQMPPAQIASKLREYNTAGMQHLAVHEAMPGHYVQAEYANAIEPRARRLLRGIFGNGPYVEGWAVYTQQMMAEQGYQNATPGYRLTLDKQLLRVIANTILDVKLQTQNMSDQEALDLMTQQAFQENEEAAEKLQRAKLSSCQLPTYFAGIKGWLKVREDYRQHHGADVPLKQFHEAALREGAVPLPVLDELLN